MLDRIAEQLPDINIHQSNASIHQNKCARSVRLTVLHSQTTKRNKYPEKNTEKYGYGALYEHIHILANFNEI